jgi:hypothetical protein
MGDAVEVMLRDGMSALRNDDRALGSNVSRLAVVYHSDEEIPARRFKQHHKKEAPAVTGLLRGVLTN